MNANRWSEINRLLSVTNALVRRQDAYPVSVFRLVARERTHDCRRAAPFPCQTRNDVQNSHSTTGRYEYVVFPLGRAPFGKRGNHLGQLFLESRSIMPETISSFE